MNSMIPMHEVPRSPLAEAAHKRTIIRIKLTGFIADEHFFEAFACEINQTCKVRFLNFFK
jgi:hypothetical protein